MRLEWHYNLFYTFHSDFLCKVQAFMVRKGPPTQPHSGGEEGVSLLCQASAESSDGCNLQAMV